MDFLNCLLNIHLDGCENIPSKWIVGLKGKMKLFALIVMIHDTNGYVIPKIGNYYYSLTACVNAGNAQFDTTGFHSACEETRIGKQQQQQKQGR